MLLINSIKILFSNLGTMWKILLYKVVALLIFIALMFAVVYPQVGGLLSSIGKTGLFTNFSNIVTSVLQINPELGIIVGQFNESLTEALEILANNGVPFAWVYISTFVIFCAYRFLNKLLDVPLTTVLDTNLNSCAKMPLMPALFKNFKQSVKYSALSLLVTLPSSIVMILIIYFITQGLMLWFGSFALFFIVFFIMFLIVVFFAFHSVLFSMWRPSVVTGGMDILPAFREGTKISFKNFWLLYTYYIIIYLGGIFLNLIIAVFTCGAGLIVSLPLSMLLVSIFQLVFYFSYKRKKYYLDGDTVVGARLDHSMPDLEAKGNEEDNIEA